MRILHQYHHLTFLLEFTMNSFFDSEVSMPWCFGATWRCTTSEAIGISLFLCFYTTVFLGTVLHSILVKNPPSTQINGSSISRQHQSSTIRSDGGEDIRILLLLLVYFFGLAFGCLLWALGGIRMVHPVQIWQLQLIGSFLLLVCTILFLWSHFTMGDNWSPFPERKINHQLVTDGLFRYARHPMYAIFLWGAIGTFLATLNWLIAWCTFGFVGFTLSRIKEEERILVELFGARYVEYRENVSALGPPWSILGYDEEKRGRIGGYNEIPP